MHRSTFPISTFVRFVPSFLSVACFHSSFIHFLFSNTCEPTDRSPYIDQATALTTAILVQLPAVATHIYCCSPNVQTGSGAHPDAYSMGGCCFQRAGAEGKGVNSRSINLTTHLYLVPRFQDQWSFTSTPPHT